MKKLERDYGEILWTGKKCIMGMPISFTRYIITSSVLYTKVGFLNIKEDEIEQLVSKKSGLYNTYHEQKQRYAELQTVKRNIDQILRREEPRRRKEQSHER